MLPRNKKMLYTIRVDVELLHDGHLAQQQKHAVGPQQQAA